MIKTWQRHDIGEKWQSKMAIKNDKKGSKVYQKVNVMYEC